MEKNILYKFKKNIYNLVKIFINKLKLNLTTLVHEL